MVLHNYEYFVAIVDEGSLTKAAEHLYVSQPSLSQYLKRLEANLGVELFDRSASPLRLTYTGEQCTHHLPASRHPPGISGHQKPNQRTPPIRSGAVAGRLPAAGCIPQLSPAVSGHSHRTD